MKSLINNLLLKASKKIFEASKSKRSPLWHAVEKEHLKSHPSCAACGSIKDLQVHHKVPFHIDSSLELEPQNLITLCMSKNNECHLYIGHGDSWKCYNPDVEKDSADLLENPQNKKQKLQEIKLRRLTD